MLLVIRVYSAFDFVIGLVIAYGEYKLVPFVLVGVGRIVRLPCGPAAVGLVCALPLVDQADGPLQSALAAGNGKASSSHERKLE